MSPPCRFNRRSVMAGVGLVAARLATGSALAQAVEPAIRFRAVLADTSPLLAYGGDATAGAMEEALAANMHKVFADRLTGDARAPTLVARISHLYFAPYTERVFGGGEQDHIEGDGLVLAGGQTLSTTHILTELPPSYSGADYTVGINRIRADSLAYQFAYWLRREMNL